MTLARVGAVLVSVALVCACGNDTDDDAVARALADDLQGTVAFAGRIDAEEAGCVGDAIVEELGADAASELGRDGPEAPLDLARLTAEEVTSIGSAMERCVEDLDAVVADLVAAGTIDGADELPMTEEEATCIGRSVADEIGFARLLSIRAEAEAQETDELSQLSAAEAAVFARSYTACLDVRELILAELRGSGVGEDVVTCLDERITDSDIERRFVALFADDAIGADAAFASAVDACS